MDATLEKTSGKRVSAEMQSFIGVYSQTRDQQKQAYKGYNFSVKPQGRKYYNEAKEIQKFCFDKAKEGKKYREIRDMLGIHTSTVAHHIKMYNRNSKNN